MKTPILSKKQQKGTLASLNKSKKETVKNILEIPYCNYFPVIKESESDLLFNEIRKFPKLTRLNPKIPWVELKNLSKEERKQLKNNHEINKDVDDNVIKFFRHCLIFGTNKISNFLEKRLITSVLISADVNPRFMVQHVTNICVRNQIPILVVPGLKEALSNSTGIPSVTFGVRNTLPKLDDDAHMDVCESNDVNNNIINNFNKLINDIYKNYLVSVEHALFNKGDDDMESSDNSEEETESEPLYVHKNLHLKRTDSGVDAFIPPTSVIGDPDKDFIKIDETDKSNSIEQHNNGFKNKTDVCKYQGLKVKRIRNNKNRKRKHVAAE